MNKQKKPLHAANAEFTNLGQSLSKSPCAVFLIHSLISTCRYSGSIFHFALSWRQLAIFSVSKAVIKSWTRLCDLISGFLAIDGDATMAGRIAFMLGINFSPRMIDANIAHRSCRVGCSLEILGKVQQLLPNLASCHENTSSSLKLYEGGGSNRGSEILHKAGTESGIQLGSIAVTPIIYGLLVVLMTSEYTNHSGNVECKDELGCRNTSSSKQLLS